MPTRSERPKNARERSRLDTRKRLVDAWRELVLTQPQQGATISQIAEKAEVAVGTFYCHFKDKESLTREAALESYAKLIAELDRVRVSDVQEPREWTRATIEAVVTFAEKHRQEFMFLMQLAPQTTVEGQEFIAQWKQFWFEQTEQILRSEMQAGRLTLDIDPVLAARSLVAMVLGLLQWWVEDPDRAPRERVVQTLTAMLLALYRDGPGSLS
jgi:AcrR family transcriptional regulator